MSPFLDGPPQHDPVAVAALVSAVNRLRAAMRQGMQLARQRPADMADAFAFGDQFWAAYNDVMTTHNALGGVAPPPLDPPLSDSLSEDHDEC